MGIKQQAVREEMSPAHNDGGQTKVSERKRNVSVTSDSDIHDHTLTALCYNATCVF